MTFKLVIKSALVSAALAAAVGVAFAMWADKGPKLLMAMVENGLAWCF